MVVNAHKLSRGIAGNDHQYHVWALASFPFLGSEGTTSDTASCLFNICGGGC